MAVNHVGDRRQICKDKPQLVHEDRRVDLYDHLAKDGDLDGCEEGEGQYVKEPLPCHLLVLWLQRWVLLCVHILEE